MGTNQRNRKFTWILAIVFLLALSYIIISLGSPGRYWDKLQQEPEKLEYNKLLEECRFNSSLAKQLKEEQCVQRFEETEWIYLCTYSEKGVEFGPCSFEGHKLRGK